MLKLPKNKVAIQPRFDPDTSAGGIIIPDIAKERCDQGIVKYVGEGCNFVKPGDYVLFGGYDGMTIQIEGEGTLIVMFEDFIKAIFEEVSTPLRNIYFRQKFDEAALDIDIVKLLDSAMDEYGITPAQSVIKDFKKEFLLIMSKHYPYFNAPYEIVLQEIMSQFSEQPPFAKITNKEDDRAKVDHISS